MSDSVFMVLVHPPVVKPGEPPAGIARIAGALRSQGVTCTLIDAGIEGLYHLLGRIALPQETWGRRAFRHLERHLQALCAPGIYQNQDKYRRAVNDIAHLLSRIDCMPQIRIGLADYQDSALSPVRSADLLRAARKPERNPYYHYYRQQLLPRIFGLTPKVVGISINYLSQALCAFALIGLLKGNNPSLKIVIGGGLITSFMQQAGFERHFSGLVDKMVCGPGEVPVLAMAGQTPENRHFLPDYSDLLKNEYLSPGPVLPFSASDGCWWRRCAFCPERAEKRPFHPLPRKTVVNQLRRLVAETRPTLIHLLDNAISPALLKTLAAYPPGAPWYGFARIAPPLDDLDFCHRLAASGCAMLKIGLESGSQQVLDRLEKGVRLGMAAKVLENLKKAGIATYVYLLFGTPVEDESMALETLDFVAEKHKTIGFLNLAVFNLPVNSPDAAGLHVDDFYDGDLALYRDFKHPKGWNRAAVRRFLSKKFKKHPAVAPIIRRDPPVFTSNHAPFFSKNHLP